MPTVAVKLSLTSKTNVEVVYGGNCVTPFHHLLTVTVLTSNAAPKYPRWTCKALPLNTHTAQPANYPSLPVLFSCVNRFFNFFLLPTSVFLPILPNLPVIVNYKNQKIYHKILFFAVAYTA
jgi:hypothetical protein